MGDAGSDAEYVLVTDYFHPDTAATGQLMTDLAVGLEDRGLDVTVYTSQPKYHGGDADPQPAVETHEGVAVRRTRLPHLRDTSVPRRLLNYTLFTVEVFLRLLVARPDPDRHLLFVSNPAFFPVAGWLLGTLRGWPYTYVVHDLWPDAGVELGYLDPRGVPARIWRTLHRRVFRNAEAVVSLGPAMTDRIVDQAGEAVRDRVRVIDNWEDPEFVRPREQSENPFAVEHGTVEPFTLVYSGNVSPTHGMETLVRAAAEFDGADEDVRVLIIGEGRSEDRLRRLAGDLDVGEDTLAFLPYQPVEALPYSLTCGDVSVVGKRGMTGISVSCKVYTSLAAGRPVLCLADGGADEARIVERHDAGIRVDPGDVDGVVSAVRSWLADPDLVERQGRNAREAFERHYTVDSAVDAYYETLTGRVPPDTDGARPGADGTAPGGRHDRRSAEATE